MMEFFRNCYIWVTENYKEITMILTSAQFISLISSIVLLVRSIRKTDDNVVSSKTLNKTLGDTNKMSANVDLLTGNVEKLTKENVELKTKIENMQTDVLNTLDVFTNKVNTILEVQSIVYSTIKDENIRNTVNSLLINAKYSESNARAKLRQEVEDLKSKVHEKINDVVNDVDKTVNAVKGIVTPDENTETVVRY